MVRFPGAPFHRNVSIARARLAGVGWCREGHPAVKHLLKPVEYANPISHMEKPADINTNIEILGKTVYWYFSNSTLFPCDSSSFCEHHGEKFYSWVTVFVSQIKACFWVCNFSFFSNMLPYPKGLHIFANLNNVQKCVLPRSMNLPKILTNSMKIFTISDLSIFFNVQFMETKRKRTFI